MKNSIVVFYEAVKFNKTDTQYKSISEPPKNHWITDRVKLEIYQGYSRAQNLTEYFRTRGATSWKGGESVTGLWRTEKPNVFYGDRKTSKGKSLILFFRSPDHNKMKVVCFEDGYYPSRTVIDKLIEDFN